MSTVRRRLTAQVELQGNHGEDLAYPKTNELHFPELLDLHYGPIQDVPILDTSSILSTTESLDAADKVEEYLWSFPKPTNKEQGRLQSREALYHPSFHELRTVYLDEGRPEVFDAAFANANENEESQDDVSGLVIQSEPLLKSLHQLGLGRESVHYHFSEETMSFCPLSEKFGMSGDRLNAFQNVEAAFVDVGSNLRRVQKFIESIRSIRSSQGLFALVTSFSNIINVLQLQLVDLMQQVRTPLQLRSLFERPKLILGLLGDMIEEIQDTTDDESLLSKIYGIVSSSEYSAPWFRPLTISILESVSRPWLERVNRWLGLSSTLYPNEEELPGFVRKNEITTEIGAGKDSKAHEYIFEPRHLPSFVTVEDAQVMFETGSSLQLLRNHQPEHPLFKPPLTNESKLAGLDRQFSLADIKRVQSRAKSYEKELQRVIQDFDQSRGNSMLFKEAKSTLKQELDVKSTELTEYEAKAYISASISAIEQPLPGWDKNNDSAISSDVRLFGDSNGSDRKVSAPPISLLATLSFSPLISAQTHLVNHACLHLLFKEHGIKSHLSLLHQYQLLGDGVFVSRLSHALFYPDIQAAELRKGRQRAGISDFELGSRDLWLPASSDLRLALMDILVDSYNETKLSKEISSMFRNELPGNLSFSVRGMNEDELHRCMNPDSIEAFDFLKLEYRPPSPIDTVITQAALLKYDAVFKLLLRLARMLYITNQLFRDTKFALRHRVRVHSLTHLFRIESHHFVLATSTYFLEGVEASWAKLENKFEEIERGLEQDGSESLSHLGEFHERILDGMMFALMLHKRQEQVMKLLEEIYNLILQFARHIRLQSLAINAVESPSNERDLRDLHRKFRKKVRVFVSECRGLSERRGSDGTSSALPSGNVAKEDSENTISHLLLKLEISGFYANSE